MDVDRNDWFPLDAKKRNIDKDCWEDAEEDGHTASHLYQRNVLIFLIGREAEECALNQCFAFGRKNKYIWIYRFPADQTSAWLWWRSITSNNMYIRVLDSLLCFSSLELGSICKVSKLFCALFLWNIYVGVNLKSHKLFCALSQKSEWRWEYFVWRVVPWVEWIPVQHICYIYIGYQIMPWSVV